MKKVSTQVLAKGIGLLELMLSLAIIAILLIMATRYYQSASTNQKINQAVDMFAAVKGGVRNYYISNGKTFPTSVAKLVQSGYLPTSYLDGDKSTATTSANVNPWNGSLAVAAGTGDTFTVAMAGIPTAICSQLVGRVQGTLSSVAGEAVSDDDGDPCIVTVTYALS
jgi:Tfp pilus assembly protein PilE